MRRFYCLSLLSLTALLLSGCATLESRIEKNQALMQTFSPSERQRIEAGQIARGFTRPMVRVAWGDPDDVIRREDQDGLTETWVYLGYKTRRSMSFMMGGGYFIGRHGRHGYVPYAPLPYDVMWREEYARATVTFRGGRVVAYDAKVR